MPRLSESKDLGSDLAALGHYSLRPIKAIDFLVLVPITKVECVWLANIKNSPVIICRRFWLINFKPILLYIHVSKCPVLGHLAGKLIYPVIHLTSVLLYTTSVPKEAPEFMVGMKG